MFGNTLISMMHVEELLDFIGNVDFPIIVHKIEAKKSNLFCLLDRNF